jgi:hypothetical protein
MLSWISTLILSDLLIHSWSNLLILSHHHIILCILKICLILLSIKLLKMVHLICLRPCLLRHHLKIVRKNRWIGYLRRKLLLCHSRRSNDRYWRYRRYPINNLIWLHSKRIDSRYLLHIWISIVELLHHLVVLVWVLLLILEVLIVSNNHVIWLAHLWIYVLIWIVYFYFSSIFVYCVIYNQIICILWLLNYILIWIL